VSRFLPHPLLFLALILFWLLLNGFSLGHLLLGAAVALVAGQAMAALVPHRPRIRRWDLVVLLALRFAADVARSNAAVARQIVVGRRPGQRPGFVEVDLPVRDPLALATLAVVLTSTPGTAWMDYNAASGRLLIHALDLGDDDGEELRLLVRDRYGAMLREIFE